MLMRALRKVDSWAIARDEGVLLVSFMSMVGAVQVERCNVVRRRFCWLGIVDV